MARAKRCAPPRGHGGRDARASPTFAPMSTALFVQLIFCCLLLSFDNKKHFSLSFCLLFASASARVSRPRASARLQWAMKKKKGICARTRRVAVQKSDR